VRTPRRDCHMPDPQRQQQQHWKCTRNGPLIAAEGFGQEKRGSRGHCYDRVVSVLSGVLYLGKYSSASLLMSRIERERNLLERPQ
jgi:hypothetical protein